MRETSNSFSLEIPKQNSQQPKHFRGGDKKVMKKSLSLFVASSMVVSMFAGAAYAAEEKDPGEFLNELGVIQGDQNGDLMEDANWSRKNVTVLMSRLLGEEEEAAETEKGHEFTDVTDAYYDSFITWAVEEGLFEGRDADTFGYNDDMTNQEFYAVVLRALGYDTKGPEAYATVPDLAVEVGLATEDTDFDAVPTRGATYATIVTALNTNVKGTSETLGVKLGLIEVTEVQASAAATGAKKITVTFNQAVDKAKATIAVKNNNVTVNVKTATWAEDNKSVVLEFANNLAAADYAVTVSGLTETALSSTVKVEAEKVAKIEFQSDKAPLSRGVNNQITLGYVVSNQYGEDITSSTSLTASSSKGTAVAAGGVVTVGVTSPAFYNINEVVNVSLLNTNGTYASTNATVSAEARVASIAVSNLYQADNKTLEVGGAASNTFKLVLDMKDQYGNSVTNTTYLNDDIVTTVSLPTVASVAGYNAATSSATFTNQTIDGSNKVVLALDGTVTAGTSTVTFISKTSGSRAAYDVVVKDSVKVDTLTLSAPLYAPAGSTIEIPFTAVDQFGNAIVHPTNGQISVNKTITGGTVIGFVKDGVKNTTSLKVQLPNVKGPAILTVLTGTNKVAQLTINVTDAAVPSVISGTKDFATNVLLTDSVTVGTANLVVKDQYNQEVTVDFDDATPTTGKYKVVATSSSTNVTGAGDIYTGQNITLLGAIKGTSTITLKLQQYNGTAWVDVPNSSYTYNQRVVEKADIKSYEASIDGVIFNGVVGTTAGKVAAHDKALTVKGVLEDGTKVAIPNLPANYEVEIGTAGVTHNGAGAIAATTATGFDTTTGKLEVPVIVVIKGTKTEIVTLTATVSNVAPKLETLGVETAGVATKESDTTVSVTRANVLLLDDASATTEKANIVALAEAALAGKDQYGVAIAPGVVNAVASISDFSTVAVGDTFTVAGVAANNKTFNFTVIVK